MKYSKATDPTPLFEATIESIKRLMKEDADCPELVAKYQDELNYYQNSYEEYLKELTYF